MSSIFVGVMPLLELRILNNTVFRTFLLHTLTYWAEIVHFTLFYSTSDQVWVSPICVNFCRSNAPFYYTPVFRRDVLWYGDVRPSGSPSVHPSVRLSVRPVSVRPFSALFSYMLWHIELKFCTWLCFDVLQIKFDCRHFASIFEGVMPLCELRIKVMCSFPHFSPTCFDILSSNFAYNFVLQVRVPSICVNVFGSYAPFGT